MSVLSWLVLAGVLCPLWADRVPLHVGGTFPMESGSGGWAGGKACLAAVTLALEDVNSRPDVVPGYILHVNTSNSKCQPGLGIQQLYEFIYTPPTKVMLLSGCSPVTTVIAESAPVWRLIVIAYGASSPALSHRERFPTLFRTHPSANMQNPTRIELFKKFKWKRITILQSVEEVFISTAKDLEEQCRRSGIRVERQSFYGDPKDAIQTLVRQDARIIVGLYYVTEARRVLCQAYHHKVYGRKYVWILIGWYSDTWYIPPPEENLNCTAEQMAEAAMYHFTTESVMLSRDKTPAISGITGRDFQRRLDRMLGSDPANTGGYPEAPLAYDAVWAIALALNCTKQRLPPSLRLENFSYEDNTMFSILFECIQNTSFRGVSGIVKFSDSGDRIARNQIEQMQSDMKYHMMGYFDSSAHSLDWYGKEEWPSWKGPPPDSTIIQESFLTVSDLMYYSIGFFAFLGICAAACCYWYTRRHHSRIIIQQSQPECNNFLLLGCALCCLSIFLMGLPTQQISFPKSGFWFLCHARISLLMFGFTFAYGSMFAKVWIVHRMGAAENQHIASRQKEEEEYSPWESIRTLIAAMVGRPSAALRKVSSHAYGSLLAKTNDVLDQPIPPSKFYFVIGPFFAIDFLLCCVWITFDPLQRKEQRFPLIDPPAGTDDDVKLLPVLELCQSEHHNVWIALILGYKCLLLLSGMFFAYESRNLKMRYINDARFIGLSIYNVAILTIVTGPIVTLLIRNQANATFAFISVTVLLCTYISMILVFSPKIRFILHVPPSADEMPVNGNFMARGMSKQDQKRFEQLRAENEMLQTQIDERERRIKQCKERLEKLMSKHDDDLLSLSCANNNTLSVSDDNPTFSTPTTLTTTALIELQPTNEITGRYVEIQNDASSTSSDEILL